MRGCPSAPDTASAYKINHLSPSRFILKVQLSLVSARNVPYNRKYGSRFWKELLSEPSGITKTDAPRAGGCRAASSIENRKRPSAASPRTADPRKVRPNLRTRIVGRNTVSSQLVQLENASHRGQVLKGCCPKTGHKTVSPYRRSDPPLGSNSAPSRLFASPPSSETKRVPRSATQTRPLPIDLPAVVIIGPRCCFNALHPAHTMSIVDA